MNPKKFLMVACILVAVVLILYFFSLEPSTSADEFRRAADRYLEILKLRGDDPVPFDEIAEAYHKGPAWIVAWVDRHEDLPLTEKIDEALTKGPGSNIPKVAGQIIDKTLQRAFYYRIVALLNSIAAGEDDPENAVESFRALYSALEPTVLRRSQWVGVGSALGDRANLLIDEIAAHAKTPEGRLPKSIDDFKTLLKGVFVLSVLYELDGIDEFRGSDRMKAIEKMAEAKLYYEIFYTDHAEKNREAGILVMGEMTRRPEVIDTDMIRSELKQVFLELIPELTAERFERSPQ